MRKRIVVLGILLVLASVFAGPLPVDRALAQGPCGTNATDCPAPPTTPAFCMQVCLSLCKNLPGSQACGKACNSVCRH